VDSRKFARGFKRDLWGKTPALSKFDWKLQREPARQPHRGKEANPLAFSQRNIIYIALQQQ
jgi:hypothetical protein